MNCKKAVLIILDGWGHGEKNKKNAIYNANTPFMDSLYLKYPNSELLTHGENVGLPEGQMGNSEVGHLNIGAGRIVDQDLIKINKACANNSISSMQNLQQSFVYAKDNSKPLHLLGLVSNGGIHSHQKHLYKICELANQFGVKDVFIHIFTDGRDCDPKSGIQFIKQLEQNLHGARIASICGRYYAMDRDNRWERIKQAYDLIVRGKGEKSKNLLASVQKSYDYGRTDEFIKPIIAVNEKNNPISTIKQNDAVICFNFRTDRCRQITSVLTQKDMLDFGMSKLNLHYTTMTNYDNMFKNVHVIYDKENISNTLGEVLERNLKTQVRIAETEKYPHVTYFFSGGREEFFSREKRLLLDSPKVTTYDLKPEMSANEITSTAILELDKGEVDFVCLNFANADMVGHTGDYNAIVKAVEFVDLCTKKVVESGMKNDYAFIIIADHGNADCALNSDGTPNTAHSINPVPCFAVNTGFDRIDNGKLGDIAPTILQIMGVKIPSEMTGNILIK